jgi:predicted nucleic acid-binding protein
VIFVDTSVLVDLFRGRETPACSMLERLEVDGEPFAIPGFCCQELLQGAKDEREWEALDEYLGSQRTVSDEDPWQTHQGAARIYFDLRRQGLTVRSTVDCWIAQLVLDADGTLLHSDQDFETIGRVRRLRTLPG